MSIFCALEDTFSDTEILVLLHRLSRRVLVAKLLSHVIFQSTEEGDVYGVKNELLMFAEIL